MSRPRPARRAQRTADAPPSPELAFCAICQVSVTAAELSSGRARRTPRGRIFCPICTRATPEQRAARRAALEQEFADDAPIVAPAPVAEPVPRAASVEARPRKSGPFLEDRVAELERAAFRMRMRLDGIEEKLDAILRRLGD